MPIKGVPVRRSDGPYHEMHPANLRQWPRGFGWLIAVLGSRSAQARGKHLEADRQEIVSISLIPSLLAALFRMAVADFPAAGSPRLDLFTRKLFTRKIVGWAMRDHMRAELIIAALTMAIQRQKPPPGLTHHSYRGSQYAAADYRTHAGVPAHGRGRRAHAVTPAEPLVRRAAFMVKSVGS
jgi:transposase InsO family protein